MKAGWSILWVLSLGAAFALARLTAPPEAGPQGDPVGGLRAALSERDPLLRARLLSASLDGLGPDELSEALDVVEEKRTGITEEEVRLLMLGWSRFDAPGAFAWAQAYPTTWSAVLMEQAMFAWGYRDGAAALLALETIENQEIAERLRPPLVAGWVKSDDRMGASVYAAGLSDHKRRNRLGFLLAAEAVRDGTDAAIAWAEAIPVDAPNDFKQIAFYHAAGSVARKDPQRAVAWYEAHRTSAYASTAPREIARKWARHHDPIDAIAWLRSLPANDDDRGHPYDILSIVVGQWLRNDAEGARAWLDAALPDPGLDSAVAEVSRSLRESDPALAATWAARIHDPTLQRQSLSRAIRGWRRQDPAAARAWLSERQLSESSLGLSRGAPTGASPRRADASPPDQTPNNGR